MTDLTPAPYSKDYEITEAMFGAFRSGGGMRFFLILWAWATALFFILTILVLPVMGPAYMELMLLSAEATANPGDAERISGILVRVFLAVGLLSLGYFAVMSLVRAAFFRGYFNGEYGGNAPLRLGRGELNQFLAMLGYYGLYLLVTLGTVVVLGLAICLGTLAPGGAAMVFAVLLGVVGYIGMFVAMIWFLVRFLPAGALTALRGKPHVLAASHVSRNRFWALFGAMLVAGLIAYVVTYTLMTIAMMLAFAELTGGDLAALMTGLDPDATQAALETMRDASLFSPLSLLAVLLVSAGYGFYVLLIAGPPAFFTRQWSDALNSPKEMG
ncbi:MAG: hypothetical protein AAF311_08500 [Pseudomonadota bacterium]